MHSRESVHQDSSSWGMKALRTSAPVTTDQFRQITATKYSQRSQRGPLVFQSKSYNITSR